MSKELNKLIEQVLREKFTNKLVSPPQDLYKGSRTDKAPDDDVDIEAWKKVGVPKSARTKDYDNFSSLARSSTPHKELEDIDLESALTKMVTQDKFSKGEEKANQAIARMRKDAPQQIKDYIDNTIQQIIFGSVDEGDPDAAGKVRQLTAKLSSYIDKLDDQRVSAFSRQEMPVRSLETSEAEFTAGAMPKASPYLVDLFSGIDGDTIAAKLQSISEFSQAAENKDLATWAQGKNEFAPFIYGKVLIYLAQEIKKTGASEAGFQFERWLGLLLNLPVAGAEQGVADNLGKIGATEIVYTSAKLYKDIQGENSPSQSTLGLLKTTAGGENEIYYFIAQKKTSTSSGGQAGKVQGFHFIDAIDLYVVEVSENMNNPQWNEELDRDVGELEGRFVIDNATKRTKSWPLQPKVQGNKVSDNQRVLTPQSDHLGDISGYSFATIYFPQGEVTENQLETTAEFLANQMGAIINQPITEAILNAAVSLKRMEANTDSYVGRSKQSKGSATSYIDKITQDYKGLKGLYNEIFNYGEQGSQRNSSEIYLQESQSPLNQLIETVVKEILKK